MYQANDFQIIQQQQVFFLEDLRLSFRNSKHFYNCKTDFKTDDHH